MLKAATLSTERICLRPWKESDYAPFFEMSSAPLVYEYLPLFPDRSACDAFVDQLRADFSRRGWGFWALEHKHTGDFMGMAGMHEPGPEFGVGRPLRGNRMAFGARFLGKGIRYGSGARSVELCVRRIEA